MAGINLKVQIEINGQFVQTGHITGSSFRDAAFSYDESYITSSAARAISLSLPLSKKDFDTDGTVTLYEYDIKGQLSTVYYPYTKAKEVALKEEAEENRMPTVAECGINKYLDSGARNGLSALLNRISWNYGSKILAMQLFIKDSYKYDGNGNRIQKITPYGTIDYVYNEENFLVNSSWNGNTGVSYTYDREGNLLTQESEVKTVKYAYNAQNRIMYSEVTNKKEKIHAVSYYGYDAFGRRVLVQDKDEARLRTLYDGFTFETVKESPTFANGLFTDSYETGIRITSTGRPTGDRYRYLEDDSTNDSNRYFYLNEGTYKNISSRYQGSRTSITVNGIIASQNADGNITYFTTDLLGSVRTTSNAYGTVENSYSYDAFGSIVEGDLSGTSDYGYLGKQFNKQTGLYNYGYRDYTPATARFTTVDPIHDGENWLTYCKNDSVNHVDLWGLETTDSNKSAIYPTAENAFNFDFGRDYSAMAVQNFKNGHPITGLIQMVDSACEIIYDMVAAYGCASVIGAFVAAPTALPEKKESWLQSNGKANYPPNNGAVLGTEINQTLEVGTKIGRYGEIGPNSSFVTDTISTASELSLPPWTDPSTYQEFTVIKPITNVLGAEVEAWAGSSGGGIQYILPQTIIELQQEGFIK